MEIREFFQKLSDSPSVLPRVIEIPRGNVLIEGALDDEPFEAHKDYFAVEINEMFLSSQRKWFREIEPMVVCLTNYDYGQQRQIENPFVVGRNLIKEKIANIPQGMLFRDTLVAGIHPFAGGKLTIAIVLSQVTTNDYVKASLSFVEKISGLCGENMRTLAGNYLKIATVVVDGINNLFNSDSVKPIMGFRQEFNADLKKGFKPGCLLLLDRAAADLKPENFFVKKDGLYYGKDQKTAVEFNRAKEFPNRDYVLLSLLKTKTRGDYKTLPVYQYYTTILNTIKSSSEITSQEKDAIKRMMNVLDIEMQESPDLTETHADQLLGEFAVKVKKLIEPKFNWGPGKKPTKSTTSGKSPGKTKDLTPGQQKVKAI